MANNDLLKIAHEELEAARQTRGNTTADGSAISTALMSIAASLLVLAEEEASRKETKEHHVH